eukprot:CFRG5196T1
MLSSKSFICDGCADSLEGIQYLEAGDKHFHEQCFKCSKCNENIGSGSYAMVAGTPNCQTCVTKINAVPVKIPSVNVGGFTRKTTGVRVTVQSDKCGKCVKSVYPAEKIQVGGQPWHKQCFKCNTCDKMLSLGGECMKQQTPFCKTCYGKAYGAKGYGYGGGAGALHTEL